MKISVKGKELYEVVNRVASINSRIILRVDNEKIQFQTNKSGVILCQVDIPSNANCMIEYEPFKEDMYLQGGILRQVLAKLKNRDSVSLFEDNGRLKVLSKNDVYGLPMYVKSQSLQWLNFEQFNKFDVNFEMPFKIWDRIGKDMDIKKGMELLFSTIKFFSKDSYLYIMSESDTGHEYKKKVILESLQGEGEAKYATEFIMAMKPIINCDVCRVEYGTHKPLKVQFNTDQMQVRYVLAPRVDH